MNVVNTVWKTNWTNLWSGVVTAAGAVVAVAPQLDVIVHIPIVQSAIAATGLSPVVGVVTMAIGAITYVAQAHPSK